MVTKRLRRLLTILNILQSGRATNPDSLATSCGLSRRTVLRDIEAIRASGIPLVFDKDHQRYDLVQDYFLKPTYLTPDEALALITLAGEHGKASSCPFFTSARNASLKLIGTLPQSLKDYVLSFGDSLQYLTTPRSSARGSSSHFDTIINAYLKRAAINISYQSPVESNEMQLTLFPYVVFFSRRSWYVVGRSSLHQEVRTFNTERITNVKKTDESYTIPSQFSLERYLRNAWHMIPEAGPDSRVVLRFRQRWRKMSPKCSGTKHKKSRKLEDGSIEYHVTVSGINEIAWWVLGYGKEAEVISPPALLAIIREHVAALHQMYR